MRVALFTETYAPQVNGVARTLPRLVRHITERGGEVALVTPQIAPEPADGVAMHVQLPCIPFPFYPELRLARPLDRASARRLRDFRPDVVHCAAEATVGWSGKRWAEENGVPFVTSYHTDIPAYLAGYGLAALEGGAWWLMRAFHHDARITFVPSLHTRDQLAANGFHDRMRIWSRGVDARLYTPERRCEAVRARLAPGAERIVLFVGRLAPEKRVDVLIDAFAAVRAALGERVALVIAGDGPAAPALKARAGEGVRFAGYVTGEALADAYAAADVFCSPSDTETFGNTVLEAMAAGAPVVVADRGGVTDFVEDGTNGFRARAGDPFDFSERLLDLLRDDALRARTAAGARATALRRGWDGILDTVLDGYREVAGAREDRLAA